MSRVKSERVTDDLARIGENLRAWRALRGMTASLTAERAGITRETLRRIESGDGRVLVENLVHVLQVLGVAPDVVAATDPTQSRQGRDLLIARASRTGRAR